VDENSRLRFIQNTEASNDEQYVSATVTVMPISDGLGAEICGIDFSHEMDASTFCQVYTEKKSVES
jgi:hypothetical protein